MKKLMITALLTACTSSAFAAEIMFKIGDETIVPSLETQKSLTVKLGQPSSNSGNKMAWKKGAAIITAEFRNGKLYEISSNLVPTPQSTLAPEWKGGMMFSLRGSYPTVNMGGYYDMPILKVANGLGRDFCLASRWINKADDTVRYTVKVQGSDKGSFYWSADTTKPATDEWNLYRKDARTQGMGIVSRVGWINEPVNYDVKKCY